MGNSISDRLKKASSGPGEKPKSKASKPKLTGQEKLVDTVALLKKAAEDAKQKYEQAEAVLCGHARKEYEALRDAGQYSTSIHAVGEQTDGLMVVYSDKFSAISIDERDHLQKVDPKFVSHYVEIRKLEVKKDAGKTISDALIEELIRHLGEEKFFSIFDIRQSIGLQKGMAERINELPAEVRPLFKQADPSVRNVTEDGKVC